MSVAIRFPPRTDVIDEEKQGRRGESSARQIVCPLDPEPAGRTQLSQTAGRLQMGN